MNSSRGVIIRHREYVGDIAPSVNFQNLTFVINPGNQATFPWLSTIATSFEQYRIRGMIFEFLSTSAEAVLSTGANTSLGTVILATEYNALQTGFTSKSQMLNHENAVQVKASNSVIHVIETSKYQSPITNLYVRDVNDFNAVNADPRLFDMGIFQLATQGMQGTEGNIGGLWVSYEIELLKPQVPYNPPTNTAMWNQSENNGITHLKPFFKLGVNPVIPGSQSVGTIPDSDTTGKTFQFNPSYDEGYYVFNYFIYGDVAGSGNTWTVADLVACKLAFTPSTSSLPATWSAPDAGDDSVHALSLTWFMKIEQTLEGTGASFTLQASGTFPSSATFQNSLLFVTRITREAGEKYFGYA